MSPELGAPGQRLCPSCARYGPDDEPICRHCGYNFDTGVTGSSTGAPILADRPEAQPAPTMEQPRGRSWAGRVLALAIVAAVVAAVIGPVVAIFESATDVIQDFSGQFDVEAPDIEVPDITTGPDLFSTDAGSSEKCKKRLTRHLGKLLANDGSGSRPLSELFIAASVALGPSSFEYRTLVQIFSSNQGLAISNGTRAALRRAERDISRACNRHYRN
jgi:hypothetical protein